MKKRKVEILVLSDVHLGTYGCEAKRLLRYLKSINPKTVVLNGDIIDIWQFSKRYWPRSHMKVVKHIMHLISKKVPVYYVTGNHDEMLRKFSGLRIGSLKIVDKVILDLNNNEKAWFFHGDIFDVTMQHSKWLAKLGAVGYDILIQVNRFANFISEYIFKRGKLSFSKRIKNSVKGAVKFINSFEMTAADIGISNKYDYVICGHIHQPEMRKITNQQGSIMYLNSGDWIENLTALEYTNGRWSLYRYNDAEMNGEIDEQPEEMVLSNHKLFENMVLDFKLMAVK
ncbi:UDP-2,3-diacylglucosamine diphosphatase [Sphingobacterium sp. SGG-5]|uniref:UDP-2,3-diacylglucosamine diphosphatase n=1 Tax=Sphingobacterium sp. SGG-5 TaxID=2710881 RepID=UPI0013EABCAB|nr:UDP-2,3-diacylglucosamine diphosphatase [Sphingobacterium sp. SGG-5]NGM63167.1 UDP-2,3-diacylglucosamine diphosphatase [Sphingobacterium sp. SGG-5]